MTTVATVAREGRVKGHIRWAIRRDMPEMLEIDRRSFKHPWDEEEFLRCLRLRDHIGMVIEVGESVVGFMIYQLCKTRLHVVNFAVHPAWRRRSLGEQMAKRLVGKLQHHRRTRVALDIRETNLVGQLFFRACGFKATRVERAFFADSREDAFRMEYRLAPEPLVPPSLPDSPAASAGSPADAIYPVEE